MYPKCNSMNRRLVLGSPREDSLRYNFAARLMSDITTKSDLFTTSWYRRIEKGQTVCGDVGRINANPI